MILTATHTQVDEKNDIIMYLLLTDLVVNGNFGNFYILWGGPDRNSLSNTYSFDDSYWTGPSPSHYTVYGSTIQDMNSLATLGLDCKDMTGDGRSDIVISYANYDVYILKNNSTRPPFQGTISNFISIPLGIGVIFLEAAAGDINKDGMGDVVVGYSNGSVVGYLWPTYVYSFELMNSYTQELKVFDTNGDGFEGKLSNGLSII